MTEIICGEQDDGVFGKKYICSVTINGKTYNKACEIYEDKDWYQKHKDEVYRACERRIYIEMKKRNEMLTLQ